MNLRIIVPAAAALLAACVPSVNPWYADNDIVFDAGLVGEWSDSDAAIWQFRRNVGRNTYALTISEDDGKTGTFTATLFELGEHRFLDLIADGVSFSDDQIDLVQGTLIAGHFVVHVAAVEPALTMSFMNPDWLEDHLQQKPRALGFIVQDDRQILTGRTRELRRFLRRHTGDGELFSDYGTLSRRAAGG